MLSKLKKNYQKDGGTQKDYKKWINATINIECQAATLSLWFHKCFKVIN